MPNETCKFAVVSNKEMDEKEFDVRCSTAEFLYLQKIDNHYCLGYAYRIRIQVIQD